VTDEEWANRRLAELLDEGSCVEVYPVVVGWRQLYRAQQWGGDWVTAVGHSEVDAKHALSDRLDALRRQ
jgi:hypothetical protein